jgi:L-alanine-DL-glutamate epimerase-like enolase superfamily enzyme
MAVNITAVDVEVLQVPVEHAYVAAGRQIEDNWHVLARVTTDDGIEGIGYIVSNRGDLVRVVGQATRELGAHLIGAHVLEVEATWARLAGLGGWTGPGGLLHIAIAPLDIAVCCHSPANAGPGGRLPGGP